MQGNAMKYQQKYEESFWHTHISKQVVHGHKGRWKKPKQPVLTQNRDMSHIPYISNMYDLCLQG